MIVRYEWMRFVVTRKRHGFDDDGVIKDGKSNISIFTEWKVIQERFLKADDNMKLHINFFRKISYLETTI